MATYAERIDAMRRGKDHHFATDAGSPIPEALRRDFRGLAYFPIDEAYRVVARVERLGDAPAIEIPATGGEMRRYQPLCRLHFELQGRALSLTGYEPEPGQSDEPYLFVPFKDRTSGKETYGGGRYLDPDPVSGPTLQLDFNTAYHPYCVYDEAWSCVIPPRENLLPVAVCAGERMPAGVNPLM